MNDNNDIFKHLTMALRNVNDIDAIVKAFESYHDICIDAANAYAAGIYNDQSMVITAGLYITFYSYLKLYCKDKKITFKDGIEEMKKQIKNYNADERSKFRDKLFAGKLVLNDNKFSKDNEEYMRTFINKGLTPLDLFLKCALESSIFMMKTSGLF